MSDEFDTSVRGIRGRWPTPPDVWSYSSLHDAQDCPRRWGLRRAEYPGIWDRPGYPPRAGAPAIVGIAVHRCLEWILEGFKSSGCSGPRDPKATEVLRALGGFSQLIERAVAEVLEEEVRSNPRMSSRLPELQASIARHMADVRLRVQSLVARLQVVPAPQDPGARRSGRDAEALGEGSHPEVHLTADGLPLRGTADLVTLSEGSCAIDEYKSGAEHQDHDEQLLIYQVLWTLDSRRNPDRVPVQSLQVVYPHGARSVTPLTADEVGVFAEELRKRIGTLREEVRARPPRAIPSPENCAYCSVRHMCDDYWSSDLPAHAPAEGFSDAEVRIVARQGARSWRVRHMATGTETLLHVASEGSTLRPGDTVRILDATFAQADPDDPPVIAMMTASECYVVT